jgi:transposase
MENCGLDLHKMESQLCIVNESGQVVLERRIRSRREEFAKLLGNRPRLKILLESSTESEWAARALEELGHEVIVADPNFAPMYATRNKRVKTDKRDAAALAQACRLGAYRPAHRVSDAQQHVRTRLSVRQLMVESRTSFIAQASALLRRSGYRLKTGEAASFPKRVRALALPGKLLSQIAPALRMIVCLNEQIEEVEELLALATRDDADVQRLQTMPSVGPITSAALVAAFDGAQRFHSVQQARSYLGLVPRELSSGEHQRRGHITKVGNRRVRALLVQAAWGILRSHQQAIAPLKQWAAQLAARRGKRLAVVALARRIGGILWAMLRDGRDYSPPRPQIAAA